MALEFVVGAATDAIFGYLIDKADLGARLQSYLGRDPEKVAFKVALTRTLNNLTHKHPKSVKSLFDKPFLTGGAAILLARYLQPSAPEPTGAELAKAWLAQLNLSPIIAAEYAEEFTEISTYFLGRLKHHLRDQKPLWDLLTLRDVGEIAGQVSSVQIDITALRSELAEALAQWQRTATTGGVNISDLKDSNLTIIGHIAGRDLYIIQQARHERACPTPPDKPDLFGGRDDELKLVKETLRKGKDSAITALSGGGGIGKTTLAKQVAHELHAEKVFRAVLWADVNQAPDPTQLLIEWGKKAEEKFESKNRSIPALAGVVRDLLTDLIATECPTCDGNRVLVVLDNVWSDGYETYRHLRNATPANSTILLTSRFASIPIDLAIPNRYALDYLQPDPGADFLAKYIPTAPRDGLVELATLLGGYPLAMELAASRVNKLAGDSGMTIARALARANQNYREGIPANSSFAELHLEAGDSKERNLTLSLEYSYNDLAPDDQRRFRQLGVLPLDTNFDLMLLERLWDEEDRGKVEEYCRTLRLAALMSSTDEEGWYRQHRLLRAYARALLNREDEFAESATHGMKTIMRRGQELDNWGDRQRALRYFEGVLGLARTLADEPWQAIALNNIGTIWDALGEKHKALEYYEQALRGLGEIGLEAKTLNSIGGVWSDLGENHKALGFFAQALSLTQASGDFDSEATIQNSIGLVWFTLGEKRKALTYYEQAVLLYQRVINFKGEGITLNNIGGVWDALGEKHKALEYYEQALLLNRKVRDRNGEATTLNNIGTLWDALGEKHKALHYYEQALPLLRAVGDKWLEATVLNNIGAVWDTLESRYVALEYYEQSLSLRRRLGDRRGEGKVLRNIGGVIEILGRQQEALEYYQQALNLLRLVEDQEQEVMVLNSIGGILFASGEPHKALALYEETLMLVRVLEDREKEGLTLNNIGNIWFSLGKSRKALEYLKEALLIQRVVGNLEGETIVCFNIGKLYAAEGDLEQGITFVAYSIELMKTIKHSSLDMALKVLAELERRRTEHTLSALLSSPYETLQLLVSNTIAVCTKHPQKRDEWQEFLTKLRTKFVSRYLTNEVALIDAILTIISGTRATLPLTNPHAKLVSKIYAAIKSYHNRSGDEE